MPNLHNVLDELLTISLESSKCLLVCSVKTGDRDNNMCTVFPLNLTVGPEAV